jgi:hypothetical protein
LKCLNAYPPSEVACIGDQHDEATESSKGSPADSETYFSSVKEAKKKKREEKIEVKKIPVNHERPIIMKVKIS